MLMVVVVLLFLVLMQGLTKVRDQSRALEDRNDSCRGITRIHRSPSRPRPAVRPTAVLINIHEHLI